MSFEKNNQPIPVAYSELVAELKKMTRISRTVDETNVFQEGSKVKRALVLKMAQELLLPGSEFLGFEHLKDAWERAKEGQSCLILMEHYSNYDLPAFFALLDSRGPDGAAVADSVAAIAGLKLNEESEMVLAFSEAYTRIVISPSRNQQGLADSEEGRKQLLKSRAINRAAMHELIRRKHEGYLILVFPTGTRYRPWDPSSKQGLKEIDSYLKSFDWFLPVSINGNVLRINPKGEMEADLLTQDVMIYTAGPIRNSRDFRNEAHAEIEGEENRKQHAVDKIIALLDAMHEESEKVRLERLKALGRAE